MSQITLCFDFGNTRKKLAVFEDGEFKELLVLEDDAVTTIQPILKKYKPVKSILSSVINHNPELEILLKKHTRFHLLSYQSKIPVTSPVGAPQTIGADRLAMVVAAVNLYPNSNNLIIGLGTAVTYNFINKKHEFLGGGISPGLEMRFKALHEFTAKLPLVTKDWNFPLVGYDTKTNIQSGVILGLVKEIDGIIDEYRKKYHNFNVLLTGGDTPFLDYHFKNKIFADPYLIYKGLYAISEYNNETI